MRASAPVKDEPILVRPKQAFQMLGVKKTLGFQMLADGRLERVRLGPRAVGVTVASIKRLVERGL